MPEQPPSVVAPSDCMSMERMSELVDAMPERTSVPTCTSAEEASLPAETSTSLKRPAPDDDAKRYHEVERVFHKLIDKTRLYDYKGFDLMFNALATSGEAGELAECVKKLYNKSELNLHPAQEAKRQKLAAGDSARTGGPFISTEKRTEMIREIGDLKYYLYQIQRILNVSDEEVLGETITKLSKRSDDRLLGQK
eukprot:TRINITY_DN88730_c0_g1_i1.p1 TRINITY_DN88730_c0_g1~~TRINITY_DN88730_c0_g1_i1.p1  ORF type:complete len:195 (+),score=37.71 TRINITY_DN88730_c0_g1_i1:34-618(+)